MIAAAPIQRASEIQVRAGKPLASNKGEPLNLLWQQVEADQWQRLISRLGGKGEEKESGGAEPGSPVSRGELRLRRVNRAEVAPIPARLEDLIPAEHKARLIWEEVEQLELDGFYAQLKVVEGGPGQAAIDPQIMVALWL